MQVLPSHVNDATMLMEIKRAVDQHQGPYYPELYKEQRHLESLHISQIYTALARLQQVGLVSSTVNQLGDTFETRRYWRSPTSDR